MSQEATNDFQLEKNTIRSYFNNTTLQTVEPAGNIIERAL